MFNIHFHIERWKWNKEYGFYVSTDGRIKDKHKKIVEPKIANNGYFMVRDDNHRFVTVHKLVISTWKGESEDTIDHLNSNRRDNRLCNLEYVSREENLARAQEKLLTSEENQSCIAQKVIEPVKTVIGPATIVAETANKWLDKLIAACPGKVQDNVARAILVERILAKASHGGTYFGYRMSIQSGQIVGRYAA